MADDDVLAALDRRFGSSGPVRVLPKTAKVKAAPPSAKEFVPEFSSPHMMETRLIGHVPKRKKKGDR
jgi:hypothetical protein